jgi:hypothetical protein
MNNRIPAIIATTANTFCDFTLDIAVNKYSMYKILLGTAIGSFLLQIIYGFVIGFEITYQSLLWVFGYGICMLFGYMCYVLSLKRLPVGLTGLIESGSLFGFLFIDSIVGYLKITPYFLLLFSIFIFSIYLFSYDSFKFKDSIKNKQVRLSGIFILLFSMLFYGVEPYLIKIANSYGANEISINIGYYIIAIPYFWFMLRKSKDKEDVKVKSKSNKFNIVKFIVLISIFESVYFLFDTIGHIVESPIINAIIHEIRVFLLVVLSVIAGTDKMTFKKVVASILGILAVVGICLY